MSNAEQNSNIFRLYHTAASALGIWLRPDAVRSNGYFSTLLLMSSEKDARIKNSTLH